MQQRPKKQPPVITEELISFKRADPVLLALFHPESKICVMNCGPHAQDPRSFKEQKFLCDDCHPV